MPRTLTIPFLFPIILLFLGCSGSTERKKEKDRLRSFMNSWHKAASQGDHKGFFSRMAPDGVYLGTDPSERWTKSEFSEWAKPHFQGEKAWEFTPYDRHIRLSMDGKVAWMDEKLKTWMGICRGSCVLEKLKGNWLIQHYDLSLMVPNEKMDSVKRVISGSSRSRTTETE